MFKNFVCLNFWLAISQSVLSVILVSIQELLCNFLYVTEVYYGILVIENVACGIYSSCLGKTEKAELRYVIMHRENVFNKVFKKRILIKLGYLKHIVIYMHH